MSNLDLYRIEKDHIRENLNKYTKKAYGFISKFNNPQILDVGCGSGVPTIELARLSNGHVTGIDIDETSLNLLQDKIKKMKINKQISIFKKSISAMDFPKESFDIIWAEGSVFVIGFENSIKRWHRYLKPNGFLVIHDENKDKTKKLGTIRKNGYSLITQFDLSDEIWWLEYYTPLEQLIQKFRNMYPNDNKLIIELDSDQNEIDKCKKKSVIFSSFYVIMRKM
jgi:ubiquinone/menaquinone biosynthesis C-methylase UbiE